MYAVAQLVGRAVRQVRRVDTDAYEQESVAFQVSFLVGGQIGVERPRLFFVYSAGNFIECTRRCAVSCRSASINTASRFSIAPFTSTAISMTR